MGETISFPSNGSETEGYLSFPWSGNGPGVLVIQEWWGLDAHIAKTCDRFAAAGFVALAPDLMRGNNASEPDEAQRLQMVSRRTQVAKSLLGAVDNLKAWAHRPSIGVVGFCMGGGLALSLASERRDDVRAVVTFYGAITSDDASVRYSRIRGAVRGHFAANDESTPLEAVQEIEKRVRAGGNEDVKAWIYPNTEPEFFNNDRPEVYSPEAAARAWERTLAFLRDRLS
jgi:carboxymethylenebutenolidase